MSVLFIYQTIDGKFLYQCTGSINSIMLDLTDDNDFTLTQPPNYEQSWYWYDNQWNDKPSN